jgi:hypothetical protein
MRKEKRGKREVNKINANRSIPSHRPPTYYYADDAFFVKTEHSDFLFFSPSKNART